MKQSTVSLTAVDACMSAEKTMCFTPLEQKNQSARQKQMVYYESSNEKYQSTNHARPGLNQTSTSNCTSLRPQNTAIVRVFDNRSDLDGRNREQKQRTPLLPQSCFFSVRVV